MSDGLPEESVSPAHLDRLLATLDEKGIDLLDEADVRKHHDDEEGFEVAEVPLEQEEVETDEQVEVAELLKKQLLEPEVSKRIDDPIRMYLTQMGQIPLLDRKAEITLARRIEITRMDFRRKLLQCDYCAHNAIDLLKQVYDGLLSFDRTMRTSPAENLAKSTIKKRLPANCSTVNKMLQMNQNLLKKVVKSLNGDRPDKALLRRVRRNRQKIATLLEELSPRQRTHQPIKKKLHAVRGKMYHV